MARHNRDGEGTDQCGHLYTISYQPDWLRQVKVTRALESGRQSTKTLFRNPADRRETDPGDRVRTRIVSKAQGLDVEVSIDDTASRVTRMRVSCVVDNADGDPEEVEFTLDGDLRPPKRR